MMKEPKNNIERFLIEESRSLLWLADKTGIPYSTLRYKVSGRNDWELIHSLSYAEYVKIENIMNGVSDGQ